MVEDIPYGIVRYDPRCMIAEMNEQIEFYYINCMACGSNNKGLVGHKTKEDAERH